MPILNQSAVDFAPVFLQRIAENVRRVTPKRQVLNKKLTVTTGGIRFNHGLGTIPVHISITPLTDMYVWYYQEPDARNVYLKSSDTGDVLISMSGE